MPAHTMQGKMPARTFTQGKLPAHKYKGKMPARTIYIGQVARSSKIQKGRFKCPCSILQHRGNKKNAPSATKNAEASLCPHPNTKWASDMPAHQYKMARSYARLPKQNGEIICPLTKTKKGEPYAQVPY